MQEKSIFDLSGRAALVTGGGGGLGRAICEAMAEFGASVACVDMDKQNLESAVEYLKKAGCRAIPIKADISKLQDVEYMANKVIDEFGSIDILFNNAGITSLPSLITETPTETWDKIIAVNLTGTFMCMRAVLPVMVKQRRGSIINISSVGAYGGSNPEVAPPAYGASKAGIIALTRIGAVEYAEHGIRVNSIAPGVHETDFAKPKDPSLASVQEVAEQQKAVEELIAKRIPLRRIGQPHEIKGLAVYLASDASSYVTGQVFIQDGGTLAQI